MTHDLTHGSVWKVIVRFALPLLIGNLLQQLYNVTDSIIVGQFLGKEALAAVSASFFIYYFIICPFNCRDHIRRAYLPPDQYAGGSHTRCRRLFQDLYRRNIPVRHIQ